MTPQTILDLATAARPLDPDDWGSERNIAAENLFFEKLETIVGSKKLEPFQTIKATGSELVNEGLTLLPAKTRNAIARLIADKWVEHIGLGFHPDTQGKDYTPRFSERLANEYDEDMQTLFALAKDPYAVAVEAMEADDDLPLRAAKAELQELIDALYECSQRLALRGRDLDAVQRANAALKPFGRDWLKFEGDDA